jgi:hypothetical protein
MKKRFRAHTRKAISNKVCSRKERIFRLNQLKRNRIWMKATGKTWRQRTKMTLSRKLRIWRMNKLNKRTKISRRRYSRGN